MSEAMRREDILVSTEWLAEHLDDLKVRIVDTRYYYDGRVGENEYAKGHIPNAVYLAPNEKLSEKERPLAFKVGSAETVKRAMEAIGVGDDTLVVGYDDEGGHSASRIWLVLAAYGHADRFRILDGGLTKWQAEGRPLSTERPTLPQVTFTPGKPDPSVLATADDVRRAIGDRSKAIVDVRRWTEFTGEEVRAKHGGRIPDSVFVFWRDNLDWDGNRETIPTDRIRARYEAAGITPDQEVITYCQGAVRAAHSAIALKLAGYPNVRVYDGSWEEWGNRDDLPIETGEPK